MKKYSYVEPAKLLSPEEPAPVAFEVVFYDAIGDLPMRRLNEFNIHLAEDAGIGSTLKAFDERMDGLDRALSSGSLDNAMRERYNSRLGLHLMFEHISLTGRALADVVYSIDGKPVASATEDEMMAVHNLLIIWMSDNQAKELVEELKKKFNEELTVSFPALFPDAEDVEFYINLIKRARLQINAALHDMTVESDMAEIDKWLTEQMKPSNYDFTDTNNAVAVARRNFAKIVAGLAMRGIQDAGNQTAYQFHAAIQVLKDNAPKPTT